MLREKTMNKKFFSHIEIPLQRVHIELTNVCDFNCVFCPKSRMKRPYGFMETGLAKRVITEIGVHEVCEKVTFHLMGEPTSIGGKEKGMPEDAEEAV